LPTLVASLADPGAAPVSEVLIVDNASNDETPRVLRELTTRFPSVRAVREPELGLSHARNRGLREATGDIICWTDDDALVAPGWAASLSEPFRDDGVVATGGPIRLAWPHGRPPRWVSSRSMVLYSELDLGCSPRSIDYPSSPWGANFALRRREALAAGGFRADLGRRGRRLGGSEETELIRRLSGLGREVRWVPAASVTQVLDDERVRRSWLVRRGFWQGWSEARVRARARSHDVIPWGSATRSERMVDGLATLRDVVVDPTGPESMFLATELARGIGRVISTMAAHAPRRRGDDGGRT